MLEIVRGRSWNVVHLIRDGVDGPDSDLNHIAAWKCQIRKRSALKGVDPELVANVTVVRWGSQVTLRLSREETNSLPVGDFMLDLVGSTSANTDEAFLNPEPVRITNRPTLL